MPDDPVSLCDEALPRLNISAPLTTKALYETLHVERHEPVMRKLEKRLQYEMDSKAKLVFSGHTGSGKSTELFGLKRRLEAQQRATIVYFSVRDHVNIVGIDATRLLEAMARALCAALPEGQVPADFEERVREANERYRRVRRHAEGITLGVKGSPKAGFVEGSVGLESARGTEEERVLEEAADPAAMLALVNELLGLLRGLRRASPPILILCDDLEKLDLKSAIRVFEEGLALSEVDACVVYTVPIALVYSVNRKRLLGHFGDGSHILPIIKVRDRQGAEVQEGIDRMRAMLAPRFPRLDEVVPPPVFRAMALQSGGVFRDLLRMLRDLCLEIVIQERQVPADLDLAKAAGTELRNDFSRQVPGKLATRLARVMDDPSHQRGGGMDEELATLLDLAAVLEYHNDEMWYAIHPLADHLLPSAHG
ncbi:MAG: hypothetical protein ABIO70_07750 [Pseudomonadota bacterium]